MNNQNYGVIGNCRTSTLVSQTEALSFIFFIVIILSKNIKNLPYIISLPYFFSFVNKK